LSASNPEVFSAIAKGDVRKGFEIKPFSESVPTLQALAKKESNRDALLQVAALAETYRDASANLRWPNTGGGNFQQYAVGLNSVVLQAVVNDAIGPAASAKVKVSPDSADFHRSVRVVESELAGKRILNEREIVLSNDVRLLKREPKLANEKLQLMERAAMK
jgi:hypothetical protein